MSDDNDLYSTFRMPEAATEQKQFFHLNNADNWDFSSYFSQTHHDLKKYKMFNRIKQDYLVDLDWILNSNVPEHIKERVKELKENIPTKSNIRAVKAKQPAGFTFINKGIILAERDMNLNFNGTSPESNTEVIPSGSSTENNRKRELSKEDVLENDKAKKKGKMKEEVRTIWTDWIDFLKNENNNKKFHPFSAEFHSVIRLGHGVSWRPNLCPTIYSNHLKEKKVEEFPLPNYTVDYINSVVDSKCLQDFKKQMKLPLHKDEEEIAFDFLYKIFNGFYDLYIDCQELDDTEATFNHSLIYPFLKSVAITNNEETDSGASFKVGEAPLQAMKKQIKDLADESNLYLADGIIKFYKVKKIEVLLLETSSSFLNVDKCKSSFDHHKGLFGVLSMMKTVADEFFLASVTTFSKLKLYLVHASENSIYLWSMKFVEEGPCYELWLEGQLTLKTAFEDKLQQLPEAINFFWMMKCLLKETHSVMRQLEKEHTDSLKKFRFTTFPIDDLSSAVNPSILKLTEKVDKQGMNKLGPFFD